MTPNTPRLLAAAKEFNISKETLIAFLADKGFNVSGNPSEKLSVEMYKALEVEFMRDKLAKERRDEIVLTTGTPFENFRKAKEELNIDSRDKHTSASKNLDDLKKPDAEANILGKINLDDLNLTSRPRKRISLKNENTNDIEKNRRSRNGLSDKGLNKGTPKIESPKVAGRIELPIFATYRKNNKNLRLSEIIALYAKDKNVKISTEIINIIYPFQVITQFEDSFIGKLSVTELSWCFPEAEEKIKLLKIGDIIEAAVIGIDTENKIISLSQKKLVEPINESIKWERIERGDEMAGVILEELHSSYLVKTENGFFGILKKSLIRESERNLKIKVSSKLDGSNLLLFVPANFEVETLASSKNEPDSEFNFIEDDLVSYNSFKRSLLGINASDEEHEIIYKGFEFDANIFSKEIAFHTTLHIQFELNSSCYETGFKQNAIPYFSDGEVFSEENEKKVLNILSTLSYWFKISRRPSKNPKDGFITDFSLYNEQINIYGEVKISKDKKEHSFFIRDFRVGHNFSQATEANKRNAKYGSFLFSTPLKVMSPFETLPFGISQKDFLEFSLIKTECFETIINLKKNAGEILRQEGRTFAIIDRFLEYQMSLIEDQKDNNVLVDKFERIPSQSGGVSIRMPVAVANSLEFEDETVVNIRLKQEDGLMKLTDGVLSYFEDACKITFHKEVNLDLLKNGFYIDKRISKRQFQIQREIIQDFLEKKIKIDHIESLLVNPEKIRTPILAKIAFHNSDLERTEKEQPDNNQIAAVKKAVGNQNIFLIQGPPGTGKTTVIAEIIDQLIERGEKILVSGQNHVAVDNVLEKISGLPKLNLLRLGNPDRIDKDLVRYSIDHLIDEYKVDYSSFIANQMLLTTEYVRLKEADLDRETFLERFNEKVNDISFVYGNLRETYKQRHFVLRDGLDQLNKEEIENATISLKNWIDSNNNDYEILLKPLIYNSADVVFATCIGIKGDQVFKNSNFKFDTVIIDEAGKANIAETLVAIELGKKVILVGDQKQLPPYMDSSLIDENDPRSFPKSQFGSEYTMDEIQHALKTSFFEFIINKIDADQFPKSNKEMLNYQHRMHPNIGQFVSESFYDGLVQMGNRTHLNRIEMPSPFNKEIVFFDTSNSDTPFEQNDGYSAKNNTESEAISEIILPRLFEHSISPSNIAIIAPYKSQVANIQHHIRNSSLCNFKNIDVSTLDSFQGKEYDIIVFSFTRSSNHEKAPVINGKRKYTRVGFLDDARRLNVAFSRAKKKLILVGNAVTLTDSRSHFDGLFNYTQLFRKLVALSKRETIGNFVNIADIYDFRPPFEAFAEKHKVGDKVIGRVKSVGKGINGIFGLFVKIDKVDCLLPIGFMPIGFKEKIESIVPNTELKLIIHKIDEKTQQVTIKLDVWDSNIARIKLESKLSALVVRDVDYGYIVELDCYIQGLLHHKQIRGNRKFEMNQFIDVEVTNIDFDKQQISFRA